MQKLTDSVSKPIPVPQTVLKTKENGANAFKTLAIYWTGLQVADFRSAAADVMAAQHTDSSQSDKKNWWRHLCMNTWFLSTVWFSNNIPSYWDQQLKRETGQPFHILHRERQHNNGSSLIFLFTGLFSTSILQTFEKTGSFPRKSRSSCPDRLEGSKHKMNAQICVLHHD